MDRSRKTDELERVLAEDIVERSIALGSERILPYDDALMAITIATEHGIAVLGFDVGEIKEDGFQVVDYSGYDSDIPRTSDWCAYVAAINTRAEDWLKAHHHGHNHAYILTSASEQELKDARSKVG